MAKSADAFRTISEVSEWLDTPAHVLRFWESKFTQVKPVKRAGGRRYYRPSDMELLGGIKRLLHEDGMTIKGVQKMLREKGVAHVASMSQPLDDVTAAVRDAMDGRALKAKKVADAQPTETKPDVPDTTAEPATVETSAESPSVEEVAEPPAPATDTTEEVHPTVPASPPARPAGMPSFVTVPSEEEAANSLSRQPDRVSPLAALYARKAPLPPEAAVLKTRLQIWLGEELT